VDRYPESAGDPEVCPKIPFRWLVCSGLACRALRIVIEGPGANQGTVSTPDPLDRLALQWLPKAKCVSRQDYFEMTRRQSYKAATMPASWQNGLFEVVFAFQAEPTFNTLCASPANDARNCPGPAASSV